MISTVIAKPTKECNAECRYCCAPPDGEDRWSFADFVRIFDKVRHRLTPNAHWIWHGGEPMLMGSDFYEQCFDYARSTGSQINFGMQSNLLAYKSNVWRETFNNVFKGRISTSYDVSPDSDRLLKGSSEKYSRQFFKSLDSVIRDGFHPLVIHTLNEESLKYAESLYDLAVEYGGGFSIRYNYQYPAGRLSNAEPPILPESYGRFLLQIYDRWISEEPGFSVTPVDQMLKSVLGVESGRCPWTKSCGGRFLSIEPNGDCYNCGEFADLSDDSYKFGNIYSQDIDTIITSQAASEIRRRTVKLPKDCLACRHLSVCEGGCARDSVLYDRGLYGKFYYCQSWKMVFDRIKESIESGEAHGIMSRFMVSHTHYARAV